MSKIKFIGIILLSSFIGMVSNPEILSASDSVTISDIDQASVVETVVKPRQVIVKRTVAAPSAGVVKVSVKNNSVKFTWGEQDLIKANNTGVDAGKNIVKVGKLLYAHNYTAFGNITKLKIGDTFTITENGVKTTYKVSANPINNKAGVVLSQKNKMTLSYASNIKYNKIDVNALTNYGMNHSLVLLTCYGAKSESRYIVVADKI